MCPTTVIPRHGAAVPGRAKGRSTDCAAAGLATGVLSNQSGIARGILTAAEVDSVNARVEELLGPFDVWEVCPHAADGRLRVPEAGARA